MCVPKSNSIQENFSSIHKILKTYLIEIRTFDAHFDVTTSQLLLCTQIIYPYV